MKPNFHSHIKWSNFWGFTQDNDHYKETYSRVDEINDKIKKDTSFKNFD
jgi:hypothetical protein